MRLPARILAGGVAAALLLAGCSPETTGTATPAPSGSAPASASANADVPKVATPLDPSKYVSKPCDIVPGSVLSSLRFTEPGHTQLQDDQFGAAGPGCGWKISGEGVSMQVIIGTGNRDRGAGGLAGLYGAHESGQFPFLEPAPAVDGYPAVYVDKRDRRPIGNCVLDIGVADDLAINVYAGGYEGAEDSCAAAQQVASAVITTLKGA
ncbi:DUF3558 domain-containing protein [Amycolatopsis sp. DG1A-15b]|uniref:DUF3558 domain-containing protein n=1 Tax=Amycolatopsis sp. DG1A-15b TaxID=3052846 RepID=UPI00255C0C4E|nr:DUF3558 domain-containing protein [Amycolatopsis sp. DG1A-15b]WIX91652.1 DUF3558 domain-containing protein [Amycolatopsis sp. DG1A-15b]